MTIPFPPQPIAYEELSTVETPSLLPQLIPHELSMVVYLLSFFFFFFSPNFLLGIFFIYISNAISKVPHTPPALLPTHSHFLALVLPCTGAYRICKTKGPVFPMMAD